MVLEKVPSMIISENTQIKINQIFKNALTLMQLPGIPAAHSFPANLRTYAKSVSCL